MRRKRLEVRVSCVSFPRAEYHFHDSNGVRVGPVTQFVPGGWMNGTERDDVILDLISGPRCSQLSQLRPVDPKFLVNRRTLVHPEPFYRLWMNFPHTRFPAPRKISIERFFPPSMNGSRKRWIWRISPNILQNISLSLNGILFEKKKKRKISRISILFERCIIRNMDLSLFFYIEMYVDPVLGIWIEFILIKKIYFIWESFGHLICTLDDNY